MRYMVDIGFHLQPEQRPTVAALVPKEQEHIRQLTERGIVEAIYISTDRSHVWLVMKSDSREQLLLELQGFPLYPYMDYKLIDLV